MGEFKEKELANKNLNKLAQKNLNQLKKEFRTRPKWYKAKKWQKVLVVCWKLTEKGSYNISKKQIAEICSCDEKYVFHLFHKFQTVKTNLIADNFESFEIKKEKVIDEFLKQEKYLPRFLPASKRFFIQRKTTFNELDVLNNIKELLHRLEKQNI